LATFPLGKKKVEFFFRIPQSYYKWCSIWITSGWDHPTG
jgi:hypothetical protein